MYRNEITMHKYSVRILTWLKDSQDLKKQLNFSKEIRPKQYSTLNINIFLALLSLSNLYWCEK